MLFKRLGSGLLGRGDRECGIAEGPGMARTQFQHVRTVRAALYEQGLLAGGSGFGGRGEEWLSLPCYLIAGLGLGFVISPPEDGGPAVGQDLNPAGLRGEGLVVGTFAIGPGNRSGELEGNVLGVFAGAGKELQRPAFRHWRAAAKVHAVDHRIPAALGGTLGGAGHGPGATAFGYGFAIEEHVVFGTGFAIGTGAHAVAGEGKAQGCGHRTYFAGGGIGREGRGSQQVFGEHFRIEGQRGGLHMYAVFEHFVGGAPGGKEHAAPFGAQIDEHAAVALGGGADVLRTLVGFGEQRGDLFERGALFEVQVAGPEHDVGRGALAHAADDFVVELGGAVVVEEEQIGIEGIEVGLGGLDERWGGVAADGAVFHDELHGGVAFLQRRHDVERPPVLLYDGLPVEEYAHSLGLFEGGAFHAFQCTRDARPGGVGLGIEAGAEDQLHTAVEATGAVLLEPECPVFRREDGVDGFVLALRTHFQRVQQKIQEIHIQAYPFGGAGGIAHGAGGLHLAKDLGERGVGHGGGALIFRTVGEHVEKFAGIAAFAS